MGQTKNVSITKVKRLKQDVETRRNLSYHSFAGSNYGVQGQYETELNEFDQALHHVFEQAGQPGFLSGMHSHHSNKHEDRRFK